MAMFLASAFGFGLNTWLTQDQLEYTGAGACHSSSVC